MCIVCTILDKIFPPTEQELKERNKLWAEIREQNRKIIEEAKKNGKEIGSFFT